MVKRILFCLVSVVVLSPLFLLADSSPLKKAPAEYVVQEGDFLWKISKTVWGEGKKWLFIYAVNQEKIPNPDLLYVGQKLFIPSSLSPELVRKAHNLVQGKESKLNEAGAAETAKPLKFKPPKTTGETHQSSTNSEPEKSTTTAETPAGAPGESGATHHGFLWVIGLLLLLAGGILVYKLGKVEPEGQAPQPLSQVPSFERVSEPPPLSPKVLAADALVEQGRLIEAVRAYKDILEMEPGNIEVGKRLMRVEDKIKLRLVENNKPQTPKANPTGTSGQATSEPNLSQGSPSTEITQAPPSSLEKLPPDPNPLNGSSRPSGQADSESNPSSSLSGSSGQATSEPNLSSGTMTNLSTPEASPREDEAKPPENDSNPPFSNSGPV